MKKSFQQIILNGAVLFLILTGCTSDFEEINSNPNEPIMVETSQLLTSAIKSAKETLFSQETSSILYAQFWAETDYTDASTYSSPESSFYKFYNGPLADLQSIINYNSDEETKSEVLKSGSNANQLAVARIMKAWVFLNVTDTWGDVPYSEALQGRNNSSPKYDNQADIYTDIIKELKEASAQIALDELAVKGDILYNGDMIKWRKFANSLLLRIGMRLSNVSPQEGKELVIKALTDGIFESNEDNALYKHLDDENNANGHYINFIRRQDYAISNTMISYMSAGTQSSTYDPRIEKYAKPAESPQYNNGINLYINNIGGMPYGVSTEVATALPNTYSSFPGDAVKSKTSPTIFMSYPELLFIKAEAIQRNWIDGDAEQTMKEAINASMDFWEIPNNLAIAYIEGINFDSNEALKTIITQKWIALYMQGVTAWSDWRRTAYPVLTPGPYTQATNEIPRRRAYTSEEYTLNGVNVREAIERQGPDNFETRMWWDKQ